MTESQSACTHQNGYQCSGWSPRQTCCHPGLQLHRVPKSFTSTVWQQWEQLCVVQSSRCIAQPSDEAMWWNVQVKKYHRDQKEGAEEIHCPLRDKFFCRRKHKIEGSLYPLYKGVDGRIPLLRAVSETPACPFCTISKALDVACSSVINKSPLTLEESIKTKQEKASPA